MATELTVRPASPHAGGHRLTSRLAHGLRHAEHGFYLALAAALILAGVVLFGHVLYRFATGAGGEPFIAHVLEVGLLVAAVLAMGLTIALLRRSGAGAPQPSDVDRNPLEVM